MDWPVVLIKVRDYLLWFGPPYLLAVALGAAGAVALSRLWSLPAALDGEGGKPVSDQLSYAGRSLLFDAWRRASRHSSTPQRLPMALYVWLMLLSHSVTTVSILVTGALSWRIAALRLGLLLIGAAALALLLRPLLRNTAYLTLGSLEEGTGGPRPGVIREWWRAVGHRFDQSSNGLALAVALGALVVGLSPQAYAWLSDMEIAFLPPLMGAATGVLPPFLPGTEAPLLAALQSRGADATALTALLLGVSMAPWSLLREVREMSGLRGAVAYGLLAWLVAALLAWIFAPVLTVLLVA